MKKLLTKHLLPPALVVMAAIGYWSACSIHAPVSEAADTVVINPVVLSEIDGPTNGKAGRLITFTLKGLVDPKPTDLGALVRPMPSDAQVNYVLNFFTRELQVQFVADTPGKYSLVVAVYGEKKLFAHDFELSGAGPTPGPISATITANPSSIVLGESSALTWTTAGASTADINGKAVPLTGSETVSPQADIIYRITATGPGGTATNNTTVSVAPGPTPVPKKLVIVFVEETSERTPEFAQIVSSKKLRDYCVSKGHKLYFIDDDADTVQTGAYCTPAGCVAPRYERQANGWTPFINRAAGKTMPYMTVSDMQLKEVPQADAIIPRDQNVDDIINHLKKYGG